MVRLDAVDFDGLVKLFSFQDKKGLAAYCKDYEIHATDFALLIEVCRLPGTLIRYTRHVAEYTPEHLALSQEDLAALSNNGLGDLKPRAQKTVRKIGQTLVERQQLAAHLFFLPGTPIWHLISLDQRDLNDRENYWLGGSHVHFINWLCTRRSPVEIWGRLQSQRERPGGSLHVRFKFPVSP